MTGPESISVNSREPEIAPSITKDEFHISEPVKASKATISPVLLGKITKSLVT